MRLLSGLSILLATCACTAGSTGLDLGEPTPAGWREIATSNDRSRLRSWRTAWVEALAKAKAAGHQEEIEKEGALLDPDAALTDPIPPAGNYACRVIKMGAKGQGGVDYIAYPTFNCRISAEATRLSFAKLNGSQRPIGFILPDTNRRAIFLGTMQLGDERRSLEYGEDRDRDMAGVVERIGPQRWRIEFPYPHFESTADVFELVPRN